MLTKSIQNRNHKYYDWIVDGRKTAEGRLANKVGLWRLHVGKLIVLHDEDHRERSATVRVTDLPVYADFGAAYDALGARLIPDDKLFGAPTRAEVINMYNELFHYDDEQLVSGVTSRMIADHGVVAICFEVVFLS